MKKPSSRKETPKFEKKGKRFSPAFSLLLILAVFAVTAIAATIAYTATSLSVTASPKPAPTPPHQRHFVGTKRIIADRQTGQIRTPNESEIDQIVNSLSTLAKRTTDDTLQTTQPNGAVAVDLAGGFGGVMLARPNGDGTFETRCVFTFEEGAEFLGLVEVDDTE